MWRCVEAMTNAAPQGTVAIHLRALPTQRELLDRACAEPHKKLADFVLEAACREAEKILCDRRHFVLDDAEFAAFEAALDAPLADNKALQRLLASPSPWDD